MATTSFYSSSGATSTETDAIEGSVNAAEASKNAAATSATAAASSATAAASSATAANSSSSSSTTAKTASVAAQSASETAKTASEAARDLANTYKNAAAASSSTSTTKANEASTSATNSANSATASANSATASASSASAASSSQSAAASSATAAASSANTLTDERIQDITGAMMTSNTESGITVDYQDSDGTIDFTVGTLNQSTSGNASTASALQTARTIHGVSFNGTANIDLSEVISDTVGAMFSSNTESGITVTYQDSDNTVDLTVGTLNQDTTGLAGTATALATARTIGGTSFNGTANIDVALATLATNVVVSDNESGNNNCALTFVNDLDGAASIGLQSDGNLQYNPSTGTLTVENISVSGTQTVVNSVQMNASNQVVFEGTTADAHETFLTSIDATGDRTISLPNVSGTLPVLAAVSATQITSTPEELNILDGVTSTAVEINLLDGSAANTVVNSKAVIYGSSGELAGALSTAAQPNITSVGTLTALTGGTGDFNWDSNTLVVDSSTNRVGIGNAAPDVSLDLGSNTDAVHMPSGTTAQRPASPAAGYFRYNSETAKMELYTDEWGAVAGGGGGAAVETQIFTGDGSDTTFTLSTAPSNENDLIVMIDGVFQDHSTYSLSGNVLTFSTAPANTRKITVYHFTGAVGGSNHSIATMTGNNSTATLNLPTAPVHENNVQVYFDGVYQSKSNFSVSGTTITFSTAPPTGVLVEAILAKATNISTATQLLDADEDTKIQVEESSDEDKIRFDTGGTERMVLDSTSLTVTPKIVSDAGIDIDNFNIDGTTIALSSGDMTLDSAGDIILDADGADVIYKDGGTTFLEIDKDGNNARIKNPISDGDIKIQGSDGGSVITALSLDMSDAGTATFNAGVVLGDSLAGNGAPFTISNTNNGNNIDIKTTSSNSLVHAVKIHSHGLFEAKQGAVFNGGNVGIGVAPETAWGSNYTALDIGSAMSLWGSKAGTSFAAMSDNIYFNNSAYKARNTQASAMYYQNAGAHFWNAGASVSADATITLVERMRIDVSGHIHIAGAYGTGNRGKMFEVNPNAISFKSSTSATGTQYHQEFANPNGTVGSITTNGSSTAFTGSSDYRLKENVDYTWDATTRLKQLKPARFNFIADDTNTLVDGFLAHEVSSIVPEAIVGEKDAMAVETRYTADDVETQGDDPSKNIGDPKTYSSSKIAPQGIDQSKLVPLLVKTIQELEARLKTLEDA